MLPAVTPASAPWPTPASSAWPPQVQPGYYVPTHTVPPSSPASSARMPPPVVPPPENSVPPYSKPVTETTTQVYAQPSNPSGRTNSQPTNANVTFAPWPSSTAQISHHTNFYRLSSTQNIAEYSHSRTTNSSNH